MATSYAAWAKFDVEQELARVDAQARDDEQQQQALAKQRVESDISASAQQSAEVLAARAAVAALKAKACAKKADSTAKHVSRETSSSAESGAVGGSGTFAGGGDTHQEPIATAARLAEHAALFKRKHTLVTHIMEKRHLGEAILHRKAGANVTKLTDDGNEESLKDALAYFEAALKSAVDLEKIVPELLEVEREQQEEQSATPESEHRGASQHKESNATGSGCGDTHCHHDHGCSCGHSSVKGPTKKAETLPKVTDVKAIVGMSFKDIYIGIGACHLNENRLAAASEAFKEVLLRDDRNVHAWVERGKAFEQMGASLLALLHFSRANSLNSQDERASEALERVKDTLLSGAGDVMSGSAIKRQVQARTQSKPLKAVLDGIRLVFREANVLMLEGFFQYAIPKYQVVLGCIDLAAQNLVLLDADSEVYARTVRDSLKQIRASCHLNIAGGYQEMQKGQTKALEHCQQALEGGASGADGSTSSIDSACHFRMGQLYRSVHDYDRSMQHLMKSKTLINSYTGSSSTPSSVLQKIESEIGRCEFDRSQYDVAYIRSRLASEFKPSSVA